jgi:SAM-dependent methyltransferase
MKSLLDLEAYLAGKFIHPGARDMTAVLMQRLQVQAQDRVLEIGGGVGATAALITQQTRAPVTLLDRSWAMLCAAPQHGVRRLQADANCSLPFADNTFEVVYAESVVAILAAEDVIAEIARVLRPGGRLALNERIWRAGVTSEQANRINTASHRAYGIPAATMYPFDRDGWLQSIDRAGLSNAQSTRVDDLLPLRRTRVPRGDRLKRAGRYLRRPDALIHSLRFKYHTRQLAQEFRLLECYLFTAQKPG